jgi:hypothetical protein
LTALDLQRFGVLAFFLSGSKLAGRWDRFCSMSEHAELWSRAELIRAARAEALEVEGFEERRVAVEEAGRIAARFLAEVGEQLAAYRGRVGETVAESLRLTKEIRDLVWIRSIAAEPGGGAAPRAVSHPEPTEDELAAWEADGGARDAAEDVDGVAALPVGGHLPGSSADGRSCQRARMRGSRSGGRRFEPRATEADAEDIA